MTTSLGADGQQILSYHNSTFPCQVQVLPNLLQWYLGVRHRDSLQGQGRLICLFFFQTESIRKCRSMNDYLLQFGGLSVRDVSTSSTRTAVSHNQFLQIHPASYKFSADRSVLVNPLFYLHLCNTRKYLLVKLSLIHI